MAFGDGTQTRERRVVIAGVLVVAVALTFAWLVLPFAREWNRRESAIRALRVEADSLAGLVAARASLEAAATLREGALASSGRRVFHARSLALAASALQALITDAADASHLVVTRLDVAPGEGGVMTGADAASFAAPDPTPGREAGATRIVSLPATLAAYCDVIGLAALLDQLSRAPRIVEVERMTVQQNSALRGAADMLQVTLTLRAPVVLE